MSDEKANDNSFKEFAAERDEEITTIGKFNPYLFVITNKIEDIRNLIKKNYLNSRERSLALTKIDEAELWLTKCQETKPFDYGIANTIPGETQT